MRRLEQRRWAPWSRPTTSLVALLGGTVRARVIAVLAAVLALSSADLGTIGAVAGQLQQDLGIGGTELGLLAAVSAGVGALASIPMGALADRVTRVRLLIITIVLWNLALLVGGAAPSYLWLLLSRVALGGATAAAGPLLASLVGDFFRVDERARVYGWILTGELIGAGIGLVAGGNLAALLTWRYAFWLLAVLGTGLVVAVYRWLPEPARGGASHLPPGATEVPDAQPVRVFTREPWTLEGAGQWSWAELWQAFGAILRIRTVRFLIVASSVGYFFFAGLRTFGVVFVQERFGVSIPEITGLVLILGAGAVAGTVFGGRYADHLLDRGHLTARLVVPAVAYSSAALFFVPGLLPETLFVAMPFFVIGGALLAAANPPVDAARLDVVPADLWGRAESVRTVLRLVAEATGPICFGLAADALSEPGQSGAPGLRDAFLVMLVPLLANGLILLGGRSSYAPDRDAAQPVRRAPRS